MFVCLFQLTESIVAGGWKTKDQRFICLMVYVYIHTYTGNLYSSNDFKKFYTCAKTIFCVNNQM